jgi:hypothetical protein
MSWLNWTVRGQARAEHPNAAGQAQEAPTLPPQPTPSSNPLIPPEDVVFNYKNFRLGLPQYPVVGPNTTNSSDRAGSVGPGSSSPQPPQDLNHPPKRAGSVGSTPTVPFERPSQPVPPVMQPTAQATDPPDPPPLPVHSSGVSGGVRAQPAAQAAEPPPVPPLRTRSSGVVVRGRTGANQSPAASRKRKRPVGQKYIPQPMVLISDTRAKNSRV